MGSSLCMYSIRSGPLPARSWARVRLCSRGRSVSVMCMSGAGALIIGLGGRLFR